MPKKSESTDVEEPKLENEETNEEEHQISPTPAEGKPLPVKPPKVRFYSTWVIILKVNVELPF